MYYTEVFLTYLIRYFIKNYQEEENSNLSKKKPKRSKVKIIGIFLVIGILFSYIPVIHADRCPEEDHLGNTKVTCGYLFHCPIFLERKIPEPSSLPLVGLLILMPPSIAIDELADPVFHPPKPFSLI